MIARCSDCGRETSSQMAFCPSCGGESLVMPKTNSRTPLFAVVLVLAVLAIVLMLYLRYRP